MHSSPLWPLGWLLVTGLFIILQCIEIKVNSMCWHKWSVKNKSNNVFFTRLDNELSVGAFMASCFVSAIMPATAVVINLTRLNVVDKIAFGVMITLLFWLVLIMFSVAACSAIKDFTVKEDKVCLKCHKVVLNYTKHKPYLDAYKADYAARMQKQKDKENAVQEEATEVFDRTRVAYHESA